MTRKHFNDLAHNLKQAQPNSNDPEVLAAWRASCRAVADVCCFHNPRCDRARFLAACGTA